MNWGAVTVLLGAVAIAAEVGLVGVVLLAVGLVMLWKRS